MAALAVAAMAATPPPPAPPPFYALMQGEAGFLTMFNGHPSEDYGPSTSPGCTTPKVAPSDDTTAAEDCREWCLATAATPLDCQFMWVYNANDTSVPGRCCPKVAFNVSSKADLSLVGRGTFYQVKGQSRMAFIRSCSPRPAQPHPTYTLPPPCHTPPLDPRHQRQGQALPRACDQWPIVCDAGRFGQALWDR